jgi:hypothetical protein
MSHAKGFSVKVGHYWLEPKEGVLVIACSPPKLGQLQVFFVNQTRGHKLFNGPKFSINVAPSVTNIWT